MGARERYALEGTHLHERSGDADGPPVERGEAAPACFAVACRGAEERHRLNARYHCRYAHAEFEPVATAPYRSRMTGLDTGETRVLDMRERGALAGRAALQDDALSAWFAWGPGGERSTWADSAPQLVVVGPGTEFPVTQDGELRSLRVSLCGRALRALEAGPNTPLAGDWLRGGIRRPRVSAAKEWRLQAAILRTTRFAERAAERRADVAGALRLAAAEITAELLGVLSDAAEPRGRGERGGSSRRRLVHAAVALLETHEGEPASVAAICSQLEVGERTMQRAFQDILGVGLRTYERERRLRAVHGAILAEGDRRTITEIAMHFGFWHLGRFAGAYAATFGCPPSTTRERVWGAVSSRRASGVTG